MLGSQASETEKRYKELGGAMAMIVQEGAAHYPTSPRDCKPVVDFILAQQHPKR